LRNPLHVVAVQIERDGLFLWIDDLEKVDNPLEAGRSGQDASRCERCR
jgi:hypothetical protein